MSRHSLKPSTVLLPCIIVGSLLVPASPASAQAFEPTGVGETRSGVVNADGPALSGRGAFTVFEFEAREGRQYRATMRTDEFDAFLTIGRNVSGITDVITTDDDGAGGTDARAWMQAPANGQYLLVAQSLRAGEGGPFTIMVEELPPPEAAPTTPIALGQTISGTLDDDSPVRDNGSPFDAYRMSGAAGRRIAITMESADFDAYLALLQVVNGTQTEIASDDDGGGDTDARLTFTLPADGEYVIAASSYGPTANGAYTISVQERVAVAAPAPRPITPGAPVQSALTDDMPETESGAFYEEWVIQVGAGRTYRVTARSSAFDAYLLVGRLENGEWVSLGEDDDGAGGTDSQLDYVAEAAGPLVVRVTSFGPGEIGDYSVQVEDVMP